MSKETHKSKRQAMRERRRSRQIVQSVVGYGITGVILLSVIIYTLTRPHAKPLDAARLASDPTLGGPASAKVSIVEYSDFGCISCRAWHNSGVLKQVLDTYGDKIRFVWKDLPIITPQSPKAAEAGQCAFDQGKFWQYHDLLYAKAPALSSDDLKAYAAQTGLNATQFDRCLDSGQDKAKVDQSMKEARQYGFIGTPSFLVNGKKLVGPASFAQFKAVIAPLLAGG